MKYVSSNILTSTTPVDSQNSSAIDASQLFAVSCQIVTGSGTAAGTVQLQVSNDLIGQDYTMQSAPTNWNNLGTAATLAAGATAYYISRLDICARSLRAQYVSTTTLADTITAVADTGAQNVTSVTAVADVAGSLASKYFTFNAISATGVAQPYYVWYKVSGTGTDPLVPGATGIEVDISTGATAATVASTTITALNASAAATYVTIAGTNPFTITNKYFGVVTASANGTASPGFTITTSTAGAASNLNSKWFKFTFASQYYVWLNVNGQGVLPTFPTSGTVISVAIATGASATTVGGNLRSGVTGSDFATSGATNQLIMTSNTAGIGTAASDGTAATGFTFSSNATTASIAINLFAQAY